MMALQKFGFMVVGPGLEPDRDRMVMTGSGFEMIAVGMSAPQDGVEVAARMLAEGVQLIELCGGYGPQWTARITETVGNRIPVGAVSYGPEAIDGMYALFKS